MTRVALVCKCNTHLPLPLPLPLSLLHAQTLSPPYTHTRAALAPEVTSILQQHGDFEVCAHEVHLNYTHLSADAVLKVRRGQLQAGQRGLCVCV